jgi:hypothetical protein
MNTRHDGTQRLAMLALLAVCGAFAQTQPQSTATDLGGTSWQLVRFQGSGRTAKPRGGGGGPQCVGSHHGVGRPT